MKPTFNNKKYLLLALLLLAGFAILLFYHIDRASVWHDEGYTSLLIHYQPAEIITRTANDVHPPLFYLALKGWAGLFGYTIYSLRSFSAVCVLLAIISLTAWLWRRWGPKVALAGLGGLVLSPYLIRYGQEARMYGLGVLLSVWLAISFFEQTLYKKRWWWAVIYTLGTAAALYTQYFFGLMIAGFAALLYIIHAQKSNSWAPNVVIKNLLKKDWWWLASILVVVLMFLPWFPKFHDQLGKVQGGFWIGPVSASSFLDTFTHYFMLHTSADIVKWLALLAWAGIVALIISAKRNNFPRSVRDLSVYFATLFLVPMLALFVLSLPPLQSFYHNRYLAVDSAFLYAGLGLLIFYNWHAKPIGLKLASFVIVGMLLVGCTNAIVRNNTFDWRPKYFSMKYLSQNVLDDANKNDLVLSSSLWTYFDAWHYLTVEHPEAGFNVKLVIEGQDVNPYGNRSAIYGRHDLMVPQSDLCQLSADSPAVWLFDEQTSRLPNPPSNWYKTSEISMGYAKLVHFGVDHYMPCVSASPM